MVSYIIFNAKKPAEFTLCWLNYFGSMSNNVGDNLNQQNLLNYAAASIAN